MNILFVSSGKIPHIGGKSTHILDLESGLNNENINTKIISYNDFDKYDKVYIFLNKILWVPLRKIKKDSYQVKSNETYARVLNKIVSKYLKNNKVDCISAQDPQAAIAISKITQKYNIPICLTMHSYFGLDHNYTKNNPTMERYFKRQGEIDQNVFQYCTNIITVDSRIKEHCISKMNDYSRPKKVKRVYSIMNFTNITKFNVVNTEDKTELKKKNGLHQYTKIILCVRRLVDKNGVIVAVKAMMDLKESNALLIIAGDGPSGTEIKSFIQNNKLENKVKLVGVKQGKDLMELYHMADIAVVPSITVNGLQEATSISAIEAMSCGIPTIASDIGGLSQLINNMESGILVEENNSKKLANAIDLLFHDNKLYEKISINGRNAIENNNSNIVAAKRYLEIFENSIKDRKVL